MSSKTITLEQIRERGLRALANELGPAGMIRFLQQFERGHGDYTADRYQWLGEKSVAEIANELQQNRGKRAPRAKKLASGH